VNASRLHQQELYRDCAQITARLCIGSDPAPDNTFAISLPIPDGEGVVAAHPDLVVSLIHTGAAVETPGQMLLVWPIKDGPIPDVGKARSIARLIAEHLRHEPHGEDGERPLVYVHCSAGVNRSALMACLVLLEQGTTPESAISRVREPRQGALSDEYAD
jgi:protein-tyrosine phosphatase